MRTIKTLIICLFFLIPFGGLSFPEPILYVNEISQGTQGQQEYVEFAVVGGCPNSATVDIRGLIIDDNDGEYQTGPAGNISTGAIRFSNDFFWYAIPAGTLIVIYNEADRNPAIPPDDYSMSDGNGRLILPANSTLLEGQGISPTPTNGNYYGPWTAGAGLWSYVSMEDDGDTFKVQASWQSFFQFYDVSWGTNIGIIQQPSVYFSGSATGLVFYADMHPANGGWLSAPAATAQTPGEVNSANNYQMIFQAINVAPLVVTLTSNPESCFNSCNASLYAEVSGGTIPYNYTWNVPAGSTPAANMNPIQNRCSGTYSVTVTDDNGCSITSDVIIVEPAPEFQVSINQTDETCPGECDGTIALVVTGGQGAITVAWADGSSGTELSSLCPDDYSATVQDDEGCIAEVSATIVQAPPLVNSVFSAAGPFIESGQPVQLQNSVAGGTYATSDCSGCLTPGGIFDPSAAGIGTYEICYTLTTGNCTTVQCQNISVIPCTPMQTSETVHICPGDSITIFGNWESQQDLFSQTFNGTTCDSIHKITLLHYDTPDEYLSMSLCEDDSLLVLGQWVDSSGIFSQEMESIHGCRYMKYITVTETYCPEEAYIYIPNAFTPDGDHVNDEFRIEMLGAILEEGYIYNRWGEVVKRFDNNDLTWNGNNAQGKPAPDGIYVYVVKYLAIDGVVGQYIGHVTLIR